jgi:peptide chain release factor 1
VAVLPLPPENVQSDLPKKEVQIETVNLGGKGGQHSNRTMSGVRMKHLPTNIVVTINGRDQHANKRKALNILTARVRDFENNKKSKEYDKERRNRMGDGGRGTKVRTYNFIDSFVKDHRTGRETTQVKKVMKGQFSLVR